LVVPLVALDTPDDCLTGFIVHNNDCFGKILSFLVVAEILKILAISKEASKTLIAPTVLGAVNFYRHTRKPISYWKFLCHHQTVLQTVSIDVGKVECEIVESLLLRCQTDMLQSFKIWTRGNLCTAENGGIDLTRRFSDQITHPAEVTRYLMRIDNTYIPDTSIVSARKDILSLLAEKCSNSLESLRISFDSDSHDRSQNHYHYWRSNFKPLTMLNFVNLQRLEISMGEPLEVLHVISVLPVLKHFQWLSIQEGIKYKTEETRRYILRSSSLEVINVGGIGKFFHFFDVQCPLLTELQFHREGHCYYGGFKSGHDIIKTFQYYINSETMYIVKMGDISKERIFVIRKCSINGSWMRECIVESHNLMSKVAIYGICSDINANGLLEVSLKEIDLPPGCRII
jgi:hypothetical protein